MTTYDLEEDSADLTDAEIAQAIVTQNLGQFTDVIAEIALGLGPLDSQKHELRRRDSNLYSRITFIKKSFETHTVVVQANWLKG